MRHLIPHNSSSQSLAQFLDELVARRDELRRSIESDIVKDEGRGNFIRLTLLEIKTINETVERLNTLIYGSSNSIQVAHPTAGPAH